VLTPLQFYALVLRKPAAQHKHRSLITAVSHITQIIIIRCQKLDVAVMSWLYRCPEKRDQNVLV